ncbi:hypothetical protein ARMGADRAFT_1056739 [Armillaria gallica]|uniref:Large ribosomal subunit protein uL2 RNA-binding domain-containing protein n=1 Tax=Armillaria gallica TaxID=47427 RepID=A0A2H3EBX9_ARMGA|nr:hypothetical protein ARMGADRAFT_1056739 [Armillaria gallica]
MNEILPPLSRVLGCQSMFASTRASNGRLLRTLSTATSPPLHGLGVARRTNPLRPVMSPSTTRPIRKTGRITCGRGHKPRIRLLDSRREQLGDDAVLVGYESSRSSHFALLKNRDPTAEGKAKWSYILAKDGLRAGTPCRALPSLYALQAMAHEDSDQCTQVRLQSGEVRKVVQDWCATIRSLFVGTYDGNIKQNVRSSSNGKHGRNVFKAKFVYVAGGMLKFLNLLNGFFRKLPESRFEYALVPVIRRQSLHQRRISTVRSALIFFQSTGLYNESLIAKIQPGAEKMFSSFGQCMSNLKKYHEDHATGKNVFKMLGVEPNQKVDYFNQPCPRCHSSQLLSNSVNRRPRVSNRISHIRIFALILRLGKFAAFPRCG